MKSSSSLLKSLLVTVLLVQVIAFLTITLFTVYYSNQNEEQIKINYASSIAASTMDKIERNYYERYGDVQAFAYNTLAQQALIKNQSTPELIDFMNTMTNYYVLYDLMLLVDNQGNIVAMNSKDKKGKLLNTKEVFEGKNFKKEGWFSKAKYAALGNAYYSEFTLDKDIAILNNDNDYGTGVVFVAPVISKNGDILGVWVNFTSWIEITQKIRLEASNELKRIYPLAQIIITDKNNKIIDADDLNKVLKGESFDFKKHQEKYFIQFSEGKGAYTYKGNQWKVYVLIENANSIYFIVKQHWVLVCICLFFLCVTIIAIFLVSTHIVNKLNAIKKAIFSLSNGELITLNLKGEKEIVQMSDSINHLSNELKKKSTYAQEIGNGNYHGTNYSPTGNLDVLGISLVTMRDKLVANAKEDKKRHWATQGINQFSELTRNYVDLKLLADSCLKHIIQYLKANQGAIYIYEDNTSSPKLKLYACYAFNRKKYIQNELLVGEGLVGQTFIENETVYLEQIPEELTISSGLGLGRPKSLVILPLKTNNLSYGVLEIASFRTIKPYKIAFLEKIAEILALTIKNIQYASKNEKLLIASQLQGEELKAQEEELRQNIEELTSMQEEIRRKELSFN
jgi:hypothetical protein